MKKKIIFLIIIILLLIAGGFFWQGDEIENYLERKELEKVVAPSKDYTILENSGGKFIVNKKDGLRVKVPKGWSAEVGMDMGGYASERRVTLYSPDFRYRPSQGCLVEMQVSRLKRWKEGFLIEGAEEVKAIINSYKKAKPKEREDAQVEIILVDQQEALQQTRILEGEIGKHISIKIPTENRVYFFELILFSEKCDQEFDKFLETISIE